MDHFNVEEPVIYLGTGKYLPDDVDVTPFRCVILHGINGTRVHTAPGLELFLNGIVLRRPDIRKIHVFYAEEEYPAHGVPKKVLMIAAISMKYTGITLQGHAGKRFEDAKRFAQTHRTRQSFASAGVREAVVVAEEPKPS